MRKEPLQLGHQELLEERLVNLHVPLSEYSFPGLFLFREVHRYELLFGKELYVRGITRDGYRYILPTTTPDKVHIDEIKDMCDFLYPIPEMWKGVFDPGEVQLLALESDSDYLYHVEKMRDYPGRKLAKKRNLVHQCVRESNPTSVPLTADHMEAAKEILATWQKNTPPDNPRTDFKECSDGIAYFSQAKLQGRFYTSNGVPIAFVLGEERDEQFIVHFAKAKPDLKGIYQFLYQDLAKHVGQEVRWINLEQDLGLPSLRQAKHSYHPDQMLKKWRITIH